MATAGPEGRDPLANRAAFTTVAPSTCGPKGTQPSAKWCSSNLQGCPCGFYGDPVRECTCTPTQVSRYGKRISGPLMDRIDLFVEVPRVDYEKLTGPSESESSSQVRQRTRAARELQRERFNGTQILDNSEMGPTEVYQYCQMDESAESLVQSAMQQMHLSARAYHRILKVSRTIADLGESETIGISHVAEALQYRPTQLL